MKKNKKPHQDKKKSKKNPADLDTCTTAPEFAEHARPNEPAKEPCDDGRAGGATADAPKKEGDDITEKKQEK
ncbi:hypothetical protein [uncultured Desulfobacter sp.]|jgi:hypothetical protein|uniref:hypothetical protein n=1 Tax=uncultured Desulfobacter sp. TaxID=240139 RepID=UPI0029C9680A|nr:hypothetical protein [uncultured Desulfobacter sp.]